MHALTDKKIGFIGDERLMSQLIKKGIPALNVLRSRIIEQLANKDILPEHLYKKFVGLSKNAIIEKLSQENSHLVVHVGLQYDDGFEELRN